MSGNLEEFFLFYKRMFQLSWWIVDMYKSSMEKMLVFRNKYLEGNKDETFAVLLPLQVVRHHSAYQN